MEIKIVREVDADLVEAFRFLMPQLTSFSPPPDGDKLEQIIRTPCVTLFTASDPLKAQAIIGTLTLVVFPTPTGVHSWIEDVIVAEDSRNRGVGEMLVQAAMNEARRQGATAINLTSRPSREAANRLYRRMGFQQRQTNLYQLKLE